MPDLIDFLQGMGFEVMRIEMIDSSVVQDCCKSLEQLSWIHGALKGLPLVYWTIEMSERDIIAR